ncbi:MAG TPA: hypothetical protein DHV30_01950 [Balneola sp.]|nr:hypothetical protein [Balneola sp.]
MNEKLKSKGSILADSRSRFRNEMDYVMDKADPVVPPVLETVPDSSSTDEEAINETEAPREEVKQQPEQKEELTETQKEELKNLSMPIKDPELMVVVPKAFDLDEFLVKREKGEVEEADTDLKYFVIGGSFIVPKNASDFSNTLDAQGFDSRILFHPGTRFNYVAYYAFSNYDEAVETTKRMRKEGDPGTWLFTLEPEIEFKNDN